MAPSSSTSISRPVKRSMPIPKCAGRRSALERAKVLENEKARTRERDEQYLLDRQHEERNLRQHQRQHDYRKVKEQSMTLQHNTSRRLSESSPADRTPSNQATEVETSIEKKAKSAREQWLELHSSSSEGATDDMSLAQPLIMPSLLVLATHVCTKLETEHTRPQADFSGLAGDISRYGGASVVSRLVDQAWAPEFRALEGCVISKTSLLALRGHDDDQEYFNGSGTYLSVIVDSMDEDYCTWYCGQAADLFNRVKEHVSAIRKGKDQTLHYWAASGSTRSPNFVCCSRLRDSDMGDDEQAVLSTILEMVQCLALQSLPEKTLIEWLPLSTQLVYNTTHLNVCNPLLQGSHSNTPWARMEQFSRLLVSRSTEVLGFYHHRMSQRARAAEKSAAIMKDYHPAPQNKADYLDALSHEVHAQCPDLEDPLKLLQEHHYEKRDFETSYTAMYKDLQEEMNKACGTKWSLVLPSGTLHGHVSIILYEPTSKHRQALAGSREATLIPGQQCFPHVLQKKGISDEWSLTWYMFPYRGIQLPKIQNEQIVFPEDAVAISQVQASIRLTKELIRKSSSKFLVLCGKFVRLWFWSEYKESLRELKLTFGKCQLTIWLQVCNSCIVKVIMPMSEPSKLEDKANWLESQRFDNMINLIAELRTLPGVVRRALETNSMLHVFFDLYRSEKSFGLKYDVDSVPRSILFWFLRTAGMTRDELVNRIKAGGSVLTLIHCLLVKRSNDARRVRLQNGHPLPTGSKQESSLPKPAGSSMLGLGGDSLATVYTDEIEDLGTDPSFSLSAKAVTTSLLTSCDDLSLPGDEGIDHNSTISPTQPWSVEELVRLKLHFSGTFSWRGVLLEFPDRTIQEMRHQYVRVVGDAWDGRHAVNRQGITRGRMRLQEMIETGRTFVPYRESQLLSFGDVHLRWPGAEKEYRIWIDCSIGVHAQHWYQGADRRDSLCRFAFKIGRGEGTKEEASFVRLEVFRSNQLTAEGAAVHLAENILKAMVSTNTVDS